MTAPQFMRRASWLAPALFALLPLGCAKPDKLTYGRFQQIRTNGTTPDEVHELIGPPDNQLGDSWLYHRPQTHLEVIIDFNEQGRVARKQWIDGLGERWEDCND